MGRKRAEWAVMATRGAALGVHRNRARHFAQAQDGRASSLGLPADRPGGHACGKKRDHEAQAGEIWQAPDHGPFLGPGGGKAKCQKEAAPPIGRAAS